MHELEIKNDKASMFYVGEKPWHGLGVKLDNPATAEQALKYAKLDFGVDITPAKFNIGRKQLIVPDKYVTYRTDTNAGLGVVGKGYKPLQNTDAFKFFDTLVGEGEAIYETAGVLFDGRRVWIAAKLPNSITLKGDDIIDQYCILSNSHDGSSSVSAFMSPIRVVCNNTLSAALSSTKNKVNVRHTTNVAKNVEMAHELLGLQNVTTKALQEAYDVLQNKQINKKFIEEFMEKLYPRKEETKGVTNGDRIKEAITEAFETSPGSNLRSSKGTAFGLYNGVTYYSNHAKVYSGANQRLNSIWYGGTSLVDEKAMNILLDMCKN